MGERKRIMSISKIICKRCNENLIKDDILVDDGLATLLMTTHDKVVHTNDYQITFE